MAWRCHTPVFAAPTAEETCVKKPHPALAVAIHQMMTEQIEGVGERAPNATLPPALHEKNP
jgi:hypothetical protein